MCKVWETKTYGPLFQTLPCTHISGCYGVAHWDLTP